MQTRKALMISVAAIALSMPATSARAASPYVSLFGGGSFLEKPGMKGASFTHTTTIDFYSSQSVDTSFKTGYVLGANWGVDWGDFRTELELAYRDGQSDGHARLKQTYHTVLHSGGAAYTNYFSLNTATDKTVASDLRFNAYSLMANVWYDFHDLDLPGGFTPYVGAGVGGAEVKIGGHLNGRKLYEKNDFVFAWQAGAGVSVPITDSLKGFLDYRYFAADSAQLKLAPGFHGGDIKADFDSHSVLVGLRLSF